ncbi:MAG TPA: hypothetical protein VFH68_00210 [Polyangia bacterium]|jgi:hypothetical protein|nr:hypothetical protein [Polyangia bacterium]
MGALGLLGVAGCGDVRPRAQLDPPVVVAAPATAGAPARGVRVDLGGEVHHARGLIRQPDGSYKTACVDAPDGLRPAPVRPRDHRERSR